MFYLETSCIRGERSNNVSGRALLALEAGMAVSFWFVLAELGLAMLVLPIFRCDVLYDSRLDAENAMSLAHAGDVRPFS